jgi:predicted ATP-dependent endonuclease of OLD family
MNLKIENIGIIKHADVKLNGLTVIAGENDSGKSTVGKLIFSIVKAASRYDQDLNGNKENDIRRIFEEIEVYYRQIVKSAKGDNSAYLDTIRNFLNWIDPFIKKKSSDLSDYDRDDISYIFYNVITNIKLKSDTRFEEQILEKIEELKNHFIVNKTASVHRALRRVLHSEFYSQLSPKNQNETSNAQLFEGDTLVFEFSMFNNDVKELKTEKILFFDDVTFIESPIVLQMYDMINSATTLLELSENSKVERINNFSRAKVPLHLKDLISKLKNGNYLFIDNSHEGLLEIISKIIDGDFSFEDKEEDFSFTKKNGVKIKSVNTASGIKAFGIIQLLIQSGVIDPRSLLIIDEPETHLHPKWQVEYARLLVELVKNDISVLVTSHSPYLIQALKVFSDKEGIEDRTVFYLSEKNETGDFAEIHDVTHNLNRLFSKLAEPLRELV